MFHRKYLKPAAAAEKIGITPGTLANWRWKAIGPNYFLVNNMIRYADDELEAWIAAGRITTADDPEPSTEARP